MAVLTFAQTSTIGSTLLFNPDCSIDVGTAGAARPRDLFLCRNAVIGGTLAVTGVATFTANVVPAVAGVPWIGTAALPWGRSYVGDGTARGLFIATAGSAVEIGADTNHALFLFTNGVDRLRLTADGVAFSPVAAGGTTLGTAALPWGASSFAGAMDNTFTGDGLRLRLRRSDGVNSPRLDISVADVNNIVRYDATGPIISGRHVWAAGGNDYLRLTPAGDLSPILAGGLTLGTAAAPWGVAFHYVDGETIRLQRINAGGSPFISWYEQTGVTRLGFFQYDTTVGFIVDNEMAGKHISFYTEGTARWRIDNNGHLMALTDNTYDVGASGATRPRTGYFSTSIVIGTAPIGGVALAVGGVIVPLDNSGVQWYSAGGVRRFGIQSTSTDRAEFFTGSGGITKLMFVLADVGKLIPGATSFSLRNNADNADNVLVADNGDVTIRGKLTVTGGAQAVTRVLFMDGNLSRGVNSDGSLTSYTLPGGTLGTDKQQLRITITYQASGATATLNIKFGNSVVCNIAPASGVTGTVIIHVIRIDSTDQIIHALCMGSSLVIGDDTDIRSTATETMANPITIDFRGNPGVGTLKYDNVCVEMMST